MSETDQKYRFDELSAGRAMGDLTLAEEREFSMLGKELGIDPDMAFELLIASFEIEFLQGSIEPLPVHLVSRLEEITIEGGAKIIIPPAFGWRKMMASPLTGWAAAAAVLIGALVIPLLPGTVSPSLAESRLREEAPDLIERKFEGLGSFKGTTGHVTWSDSKQQGYMTLRGIPMNDPQKAQYQLWIVDPKRDEAPVDGGVFDIPADGSAVVIPIVAKLALSKPQAFVITLEQPGGVVKSKQEQVVALAKN